MYIAVTGHRPDKIGGYDFLSTQRRWIRHQLRDKLIENRPTACISGMALGTDQDFAWTAMFLGIPVLAVIPFVGQESRWNASAQAFYRSLLERCYHIQVVCPGEYAAWKMQKRNEWMVDHCELLLAVWDGSSGGTENCLEYAHKIGRRVIRINPNDFFEVPRDS